MLGYVAKVNLYLLKHLIFSFMARRCLQRKNCSWSAQANTAQSPTPRSVRHFWICGKFNC